MESTVNRCNEDIAACNILGVDYLHWDVLDCIYRIHPVTKKPLYTSEGDIFGDLHSTESYLIDTLAQQMATLPNHNHVYVPLNVANHVDHQLTRISAERNFSSIYF